MTENMIPIDLESELPLLQHGTLFSDGTVSVCRNSVFQQIYIISKNVTNSTGTRTYSLPICMFLMKKRRKIDYLEILNFLKNKYCSKFQVELEIKAFHADAELSKSET